MCMYGIGPLKHTWSLGGQAIVPILQVRKCRHTLANCFRFSFGPRWNSHLASTAHCHETPCKVAFLSCSADFCLSTLSLPKATPSFPVQHPPRRTWAHFSWLSFPSPGWPPMAPPCSSCVDQTVLHFSSHLLYRKGWKNKTKQNQQL